MLAKLHRYMEAEKPTRGEFTSPWFQCKTIELPWKYNQVNVSCIVAGTYWVEKHTSPTHGLCFEVQDVPGRTHILFHVANYIGELKGCIAPGKKHIDLDGDGLIDVSSSRQTLNEMLRLMPDRFQLQIIEHHV